MSEARVEDLDLAQIDVSDPQLYLNDNWGAYFARLRAEAPVHFQENSPTGPYWSVSAHALHRDGPVAPRPGFAAGGW